MSKGLSPVASQSQDRCLAHARRPLGWWAVFAVLFAALFAPVRHAWAQCEISIEQFGDPRLENPTFLTSGDPDGAGPLPEQFLVSARTNFSSSQLQIITENTTVALPWTIPVGSAVMYQGQWHFHTTGDTPGSASLRRWNGTTVEQIPQVAGVIRGITVHEGEIYAVTSIVNGTFTGQIIRWNGERAQVVGRTTLRPNVPTRVEFASVGSTLYIAGGFTLVENVPANGVAAFSPSTSTGTWTSPQFPAFVPTPIVRALAVLDNRVYALADGSTGSNFFGLNPTGSAWEFARDATTPTRGPSSSSDATLVATGGFIYAFTVAGGGDGYRRGDFNVPLGYGFYRWNGTHWLDMTGLAPEWRNMQSYRSSASDGRVLATRYRGQFAFVALLRPSSLSRFPAITAIMLWDGTKFTLFNKGISGEITDMVEYEGGQVVVGFFDFAGGQLVEGVAWWDGQTFHPMGPNPRPNWNPGGLGFHQAHVMNGELYLAGEFFFGPSGTDFRRNVARWSGADWLSAFSGSSFPISQVFGLSSTGTTLIAGGTNRYVEVTAGVARSFQQLGGYGFAQRGDAFYFASDQASAGRVGVREGPGVYRWLTPPPVSLPPDRLLAFRDEVLTFSVFIQASNGASSTSIQRLLPDGRLVPAGTWYNNTGTINSSLPAEFHGDAWWGGQLRNQSSSTPSEPFVRWNGIETVAPPIVLNGVDLTQRYQWGRHVARVQRTDGTDELWLNLRGNTFSDDVFPPSVLLRYRASAPPVITQQPVTPIIFPNEPALFSFHTLSSEGVTFAWRFNHIALSDGYVPGLGLVSGSRTTNLTINNLERFDGTIDAVATTNCGTSYTNAVPLAIVRCDSIDFNNDNLFPTDEDLIDFLSILAGGPCSPGNTCNDIDFNNDGMSPSDDDLLAFLRVLAGGTC